MKFEDGYTNSFNCRIALSTAIALTLVCSDLSAAETDIVEQCALAHSKAAQVDCLESAVRRLSAQSVASPEIMVKNKTSVDEHATDNITVAKKVLPVTSAAIEAGPVGAVANSDIPDAKAGGPDEPVAAVDANARELGAEQVAIRNGDDDKTLRVSATVVSHSTVGYEKVRVRLDNGQIWQQTDGDRVRAMRRIRNEPTFAVEMWETKLGGFRMHIPDKNLTLRVRRIQ